MNLRIVGIAFLILLTGSFATASSAIGMECYNSNADLKGKKPSNYNFLIVNLVFAILSILIGIFSIYAGFTSPY